MDRQKPRMSVEQHMPEPFNCRACMGQIELWESGLGEDTMQSYRAFIRRWGQHGSRASMISTLGIPRSHLVIGK